jgi:tellurite resistance protein TehA-like permease
VLFDLYNKKFAYYLYGLAVIVVFTVILYFVIHPSPGSHPYNVSFFTLTFAVVCLLFAMYHLLYKGILYLVEKYVVKRKTSGQIPLIGMMSKNLLLYFIIRYPLGMLGHILYTSLFSGLNPNFASITIMIFIIASLYGLEKLLVKLKIQIKL